MEREDFLKYFVGNPEGKLPIDSPRFRQDDIKFDLRREGYVGF